MKVGISCLVFSGSTCIGEYGQGKFEGPIKADCFFCSSHAGNIFKVDMEFYWGQRWSFYCLPAICAFKNIFTPDNGESYFVLIFKYLVLVVLRLKFIPSFTPLGSASKHTGVFQ